MLNKIVEFWKSKKNDKQQCLHNYLTDVLAESLIHHWDTPYLQKVLCMKRFTRGIQWHKNEIQLIRTSRKQLTTCNFMLNSSIRIISGIICKKWNQYSNNNSESRQMTQFENWFSVFYKVEHCVSATSDSIEECNWECNFCLIQISVVTLILSFWMLGEFGVSLPTRVTKIDGIEKPYLGTVYRQKMYDWKNF